MLAIALFVLELVCLTDMLCLVCLVTCMFIPFITGMCYTLYDM